MNSHQVPSSLLEKMIVNWATVPDAVFYAIRSKITSDKYMNQSFSNRIATIYYERNRKYERLLHLRNKYPQHTERIKKVHLDSWCAYTRFLLSHFHSE